MKASAATPGAGARCTDPDRRHAIVWHAALTALGIIAAAESDLEELHEHAHPGGCSGCRICRATLPLLRRVIAAAGPDAPAPPARATPTRRPEEG